MKIIRENLKLYLLLTFFVFCFISSIAQENGNINKQKVEDTSVDKGKYIISAPVVYKSFILKNGAVSDIKELYVQRSIQDYYIKFCESEITRKYLENYLANISDLVKVVKMEIEIRDGYWDICDGNYMQQSRIGEYIIIHRIIEE